MQEGWWRHGLERLDLPLARWMRANSPALVELDRSEVHPLLPACSELLPSLFGDPTVSSTWRKWLGQMNEYLGGHRGPFWLGNSQRGS